MNRHPLIDGVSQGERQMALPFCPLISLAIAWVRQATCLCHKAISVEQTQMAMLLNPSNQLYSVAFSQTEKKRNKKEKL